MSPDPDPQVAVFIGPTLHPSEAAGLFKALYLPPIKRGDLALLPKSVCAIGIVDGEFYQSLAVSPKEILIVLERGVAVYGASSIGALRAVELHRHGMIGVGSVFRLFRAGFLDADDEVALSYAPHTFKAVSDPLVNTRYALRAAVRRRILESSEASAIVGHLKNVYFPDRTRMALLILARDVIGPERTGRLRDFLADQDLNIRTANVKRTDALRMLALISRDVAATSRNAAQAIAAPSDRRDLDFSDRPQTHF
jgi:hypothetical protein